MAIIINAKGTSVPHFTIGKNGVTVYQGNIDPSLIYTMKNGDVWVNTTETSMFLWSTTSSTWVSSKLTYDDLPIKLYKENPIAGSVSDVSGDNSVAIGNSAKSSLTGQISVSNGAFATVGDAQQSLLILRTETTNATPTSAFLDGTSGSKKIIIGNNSSYTFSISIIARRTDSTGGHAGFKFEGVIYKDSTAGSVSFLGTPSKTIIGKSDSAWDASIVADISDGSLGVTCTGETGKTIRWVATVNLTEVTN